jgi:hypothetical protein
VFPAAFEKGRLNIDKKGPPSTLGKYLVEVEILSGIPVCGGKNLLILSHMYKVQTHVVILLFNKVLSTVYIK